MTINFPGPYELRMFYTCSVTGSVLQHEARYNVILSAPPAPGTAFSAINAVTRGGINVDLAGFMESWVDLFLALYPSTACSISHVELWEYEPESFLSSFISTYEIAEAGVGGANLTPAGQYQITFRTIEGGIMKLNFMETTQLSGVTDTPPFTPAAAEAIRVAVSGTGNVFLGRDTSYPFAAIAAYPGINEALFKRRFRPD